MSSVCHFSEIPNAVRTPIKRDPKHPKSLNYIKWSSLDMESLHANVQMEFCFVMTVLFQVFCKGSTCELLIRWPGWACAKSLSGSIQIRSANPKSEIHNGPAPKFGLGMLFLFFWGVLGGPRELFWIIASYYTIWWRWVMVMLRFPARLDFGYALDWWNIRWSKAWTTNGACCSSCFILLRPQRRSSLQRLSRVAVPGLACRR